MLAGILNYPMSKEELNVWAFSHQDQHSKIINAIYQRDGTSLPDYNLDPMPSPDQTDEMGSWAYAHQSAHTQFEAVLGIGGSDLTAIDFSKQDQVESWLRLHFETHLQAQLALGFPD